jgi:hypothetical protein
VAISIFLLILQSGILAEAFRVHLIRFPAERAIRNVINLDTACMMRAIEFNKSMDNDFHSSPPGRVQSSSLTAVQQIEEMPINCSLYHIKAADGSEC